MLRSFRIAGMAVFDWMATLIVAVIVSFYTRYSTLAIFTALILISIPLHYVFGVDTVSNRFLGIRLR